VTDQTAAIDSRLGRWPAQTRPMGIGFMCPIAEDSAFGRPVRVADMVEMALTAEAAGYDSLWLADHLIFRPPVAPEGEQNGPWEAWTVAAAIAQATSTINVGLLVTCLGWRNPGIVARMTETIDDLSQGRFILGVGAGWHEPEYDAYGFPFDARAPPASRTRSPSSTGCCAAGPRPTLAASSRPTTPRTDRAVPSAGPAAPRSW